MPAYLIFTGIVIGYVLHLIGNSNNYTGHREYTLLGQKNISTSFIQGIIIGIALALLYIFV